VYASECITGGGVAVLVALVGTAGHSSLSARAPARPAARKYIRRRKSVCRRTHAAVCRPASATAAAEVDGTGEWQPRRPRPGRDGRDWRGARRAVYSSFKPTEQLDDTIDSLVVEVGVAGGGVEHDRRAPPGKPTSRLNFPHEAEKNEKIERKENVKNGYA